LKSLPGRLFYRTAAANSLLGKPVGIEIVGTRPIIATSPGGLFSWGTQNSPEFLLRRNAVRYGAVSHHHFDHIGGVRAAAAMGATILVEKSHEPILRPLLEARHTDPQDEHLRIF
jgi:hypothetical protein